MRPFFSVCLFPYSKNTKKVRIIFIFVKTNSYKMRKIEHIGIAVKNLETSNTLFEKLLGVPAYKEEEVASEGVKTSFFMNGPNKIELLEATNADSPIAKFIEKKGEGIHHIAFDVEDIAARSEERRVGKECRCRWEWCCEGG